MVTEEVKALIVSERDALAGILVGAARAALAELSSGDRFAFDLGEGLREVCGKVGGGEFVRDRPSSGMLSALYEGPAKWSAALEALLDRADDIQQSHIRILDLGFGAAAPAVAAAVLATHWSAVGKGACPKFQVHTIDASPFVLAFLQHHLWPRIQQHYAGAASIELVFDHNTCMLDSEVEDKGVWVFAGYLFDHQSYRDEFVREFSEAIEIRQPDWVWVAGPAQSISRADGLWEEIRKAEYQIKSVGLHCLRGELKGTMEVHRDLLRKAEGTVRMLNPPSWSEPEISCVGCSFQGVRQMSFGESTGAPWDMYTPKLRSRTEVELNEQQREASIWAGKVRPTLISGPAGSGKSLVLTERLANMVRKPPRELGMVPFDPRFRILVTTFNKELSSELKGWIGDVLGGNAVEDDGGFVFSGSDELNIRLLHFDILPTRIGRFGRYGSRLHGSSAALSINQVIRDVREELKLAPSEHGDLLNSDYIEEEFNRVFYGMELNSLKEYSTVSRKGRTKKGGGADQRRIVGKVMEEWMKRCHESGTYTFHMIRRMFLHDLKAGWSGETFTDIFVDEFQDCTPADFSIFYKLLDDPNRLVVAGDLAQSVHLGRSADRPRDRSDEMGSQRRFRTFTLSGSYRLPLHVSLCLEGLSDALREHQSQGGAISPYEGAPPGVRLLFVSSSSTEDMASKLAAMMAVYQPYRRRLLGEGADERAVIMESDKELAKAVSKLRPNSINSDTILRLKGLEKSMVIWSTRALYQSEDDSMEYVYTILTRSSGLAVVAHFEGDTPGAYQAILNTLNPELLLPWDQHSRDVLADMNTESFNDNDLAF